MLHRGAEGAITSAAGFYERGLVLWHNLVRDYAAPVRARPEGGQIPKRTVRIPRREACPEDMVTYADLFAFVIMLCAVITLVIYAIRKK